MSALKAGLGTFFWDESKRLIRTADGDGFAIRSRAADIISEGIVKRIREVERFAAHGPDARLRASWHEVATRLKNLAIDAPVETDVPPPPLPEQVEQDLRAITEALRREAGLATRVPSSDDDLRSMANKIHTLLTPNHLGTTREAFDRAQNLRPSRIRGFRSDVAAVRGGSAATLAVIGAVAGICYLGYFLWPVAKSASDYIVGLLPVNQPRSENVSTLQPNPPSNTIAVSQSCSPATESSQITANETCGVRLSIRVDQLQQRPTPDLQDVACVGIRGFLLIPRVRGTVAIPASAPPASAPAELLRLWDDDATYVGLSSVVRTAPTLRSTVPQEILCQFDSFAFHAAGGAPARPFDGHWAVNPTSPNLPPATTPVEQQHYTRVVAAGLLPLTTPARRAFDQRQFASTEPELPRVAWRTETQPMSTSRWGTILVAVDQRATTLDLLVVRFVAFRSASQGLLNPNEGDRLDLGIARSRRLHNALPGCLQVPVAVGLEAFTISLQDTSSLFSTATHVRWNAATPPSTVSSARVTGSIVPSSALERLTSEAQHAYGSFADETRLVTMLRELGPLAANPVEGLNGRVVTTPAKFFLAGVRIAHQSFSPSTAFNILPEVYGGLETVAPRLAGLGPDQRLVPTSMRALERIPSC